jgi:hypothetical protein
VVSVNGYSVDFTQGLSRADPLYRVRLRAVGVGSTIVIISVPSQPDLAPTAPFGLKVARTDNDGNPAAVAYPNPIQLTVTSSSAGFVAPYGNGCVASGGLAPTLDGSGCVTPGGSVTLVVEGGLPGALPNLFLGFSDVSAQLNPWCAIQNLPLALSAPILLPPLAGTQPGEGSLVLPLPIPTTVPLNISVYMQALFVDNGVLGGISSTNPVQLFFGL